MTSTLWHQKHRYGLWFLDCNFWWLIIVLHVMASDHSRGVTEQFTRSSAEEFQGHMQVNLVSSSDSPLMPADSINIFGVYVWMRIKGVAGAWRDARGQHVNLELRNKELRNTHRELCLCYQSPLEYLAASSASSSHWRGLRSARKSHWSCCLAHPALWCSRLVVWILGWGTRRCWAQERLSAPWCDPVVQSGWNHRSSHQSHAQALWWANESWSLSSSNRRSHIGL